MYLRILVIILPVVSIIALGYIYGRRARPDMTAVNRINMNVLCPFLVFGGLASKSFDLASDSILIPCSVGIVLGSGLLAWPFERLLKVDLRTFLPPMMFNNCGNMGIPLAALAFGDAGLSAMVMLFSISNLLHFTVGQYIVFHGAQLRQVLRIPMIHATWLGFLFAILRIHLPDWLMTPVRMLGDASIPLMLFSLGVRMLGVSLKDWKLGVVGGIVCPATGLAMAAVMSHLLALSPLQTGLLFLFGSLPPAVLNFMVAEQYRQEPAKVASIVLIGNLFAIVSVPLGLALGLR
jgi:predicted permease